MRTEVDVGMLVLSELENGEDYESIVSRNLAEIESLKKEIKKGVLPKVFSIPSQSALAPKDEKDFELLVEMLDLKNAPYSFIEKVTEKMLTYPAKYLAVKRVFASLLREVVVAHLSRDRRLDRLLFKSLMLVVSRSSPLFSQTIAMPLLCAPEPESGGRLSSSGVQILARVIMKARTNRDYMQVFVEDLLKVEPSPSLSTMLMSVFIKKLRFGGELLAKCRAYIVESCRERGTYLAWNNMVLAFVRAYAGAVDAEDILRFYESVRDRKEIEQEIIEEIRKARKAE